MRYYYCDNSIQFWSFMKSISLLFLSLLLSPTLFSQTSVSGIISNNTIWTSENSPYIISDDLGVKSGVELKIDPGVEVLFDQDSRILIKGSLSINGESRDLVTFRHQNTSSDRSMIIFKETDLSLSRINNVKFITNEMNFRTAIAIAEESEHNQDQIKNSDTLRIENSIFINTGIETDGYDTEAAIKILNSTFESSLIRGNYPRTEPIIIVNSVIIDSELRSDSYNKGIKLNNSIVTDTEIFMGCCSANFIFSNTIVIDSPVREGGGSPVNGNFEIIESKFIDSPIILSSASYKIENSIFKGGNDLLVHFGNGYINTSNFVGGGANQGIVVTGYTGYNIGGQTSINNSKFTNFSEAIIFDGVNNVNLQQNFFNKNKNYNIKNNSSIGFEATQNYWGETVIDSIESKIYDGNDNLDKGVIIYTPILESFNISSPISEPVNLIKEITSDGRIKLSWDNNQESDVAGYKVYYGNFNGYSFSNSIDVGNVTQIELDLPVHYKDSVIALTAYDLDFDGNNDMTDGNESWFTESVYYSVFYLEDNGVTINCSDAEIGDTFTINGITYIKRSIDQINENNASSTCTSGISDMSFLFEGDIQFPDDFSINHWDMSDVVTTRHMFLQNPNFNHDISDWNFEILDDMTGMFQETINFNQNIGSWNVSSVTKFGRLFAACGKFNQNLNTWDVSNGIEMYDMFASWHQNSTFNGDISNWNVSKVRDMSNMFSGATEFNQDISNWDVSSVLNMDYMFSSTHNLNITLINWDVSSVTSMIGMFLFSNYNLPINSWDVSSVVNMKEMFHRAYNFNQPLSDWDVSNVTNMQNMFSESVFNQNISNWETKNVLDMDYMFLDNNVFNQDISEWCVSNINDEPTDFVGVNTSLENLPEWGRCNEIELYIPHNSTYTIDTTYTGIYQKLYSNQGYNSFQFRLNYDPDSIKVSILDFENIISSDFELVLNHENPGEIIIGGTGLVPIIEDGKLLNLKIEYKLGGSSYIYLNDLIFDEGLVVGDNSKTNINTEFLLCGDVTLDESVSALDASHILRHSVRLSPQYPFDEKKQIAGDVTGNGSVSPYDAYFVLKDVVGIGDDLRCSTRTYNLKEVWKPTIKTKTETHMKNFKSKIGLVDDISEIYSLELKLDDSYSIDLQYIPEDWKIMENRLGGNLYLSMFGLTPISDFALVWNHQTRKTLEAEIRLNESQAIKIIENSNDILDLPQQYTLSQNYPNPFNPSTQIKYALPEATQVTLEVFNSLGQKVIELVKGQKSAGYHTATFDASGFSSGVYLYKLTTPVFSQTNKMLLIK